MIFVFARAKRGRVVENEYEKANCRHDTATLEARRKRNAEMPKGWCQNRSSVFFKRPTSSLKREHFRRKMAKSTPTSYLKRKHFRRKTVQSRPTSTFKRELFQRKSVKSRHFLASIGVDAAETDSFQADRPRQARRYL